MLSLSNYGQENPNIYTNPKPNFHYFCTNTGAYAFHNQK